MKSPNSQYAHLCLLELNASLAFESNRAKLLKTKGLATIGQVDFIVSLIDNCKMEEKEHRYYMAMTSGLAFDDVDGLINELEQRLNPPDLNWPPLRPRLGLTMVLADEDYKIIEEKKRGLFVLDSVNRYCRVKGLHPDFYSRPQLERRTFDVDISKTLKGTPVWSGKAVII